MTIGFTCQECGKNVNYGHDSYKCHSIKIDKHFKESMKNLEKLSKSPRKPKPPRQEPPINDAIPLNVYLTDIAELEQKVKTYKDKCKQLEKDLSKERKRNKKHEESIQPSANTDAFENS